MERNEFRGRRKRLLAWILAFSLVMSGFWGIPAEVRATSTEGGIGDSGSIGTGYSGIEVTIDPNNGEEAYTSAMSTEDTTEGLVYMTLPEAPEKVGYEFEGWLFSADNQSSVLYEAGAYVSCDMYSTNVKFTAQWIE